MGVRVRVQREIGPWLTVLSPFLAIAIFAWVVHGPK